MAESSGVEDRAARSSFVRNVEHLQAKPQMFDAQFKASNYDT